MACCPSPGLGDKSAYVEPEESFGAPRALSKVMGFQADTRKLCVLVCLDRTNFRGAMGNLHSRSLKANTAHTGHSSRPRFLRCSFRIPAIRAKRSIRERFIHTMRAKEPFAVHQHSKTSVLSFVRTEHLFQR